MTRIENSVVIGRPAEAVWKFYTDLSNIRALDPGIEEARQVSPGPFGMGSTFSLRWKEGRWPLVFRVTEYEPNRRLAYECISPDPVKGSTDSYSLEPLEGGTRFAETLDIKSSGIMRLVGSFFGQRAREDSGVRLAALKERLESVEPQAREEASR